MKVRELISFLKNIGKDRRVGGNRRKKAVKKEIPIEGDRRTVRRRVAHDSKKRSDAWVEDRKRRYGFDKLRYKDFISTRYTEDSGTLVIGNVGVDISYDECGEIEEIGVAGLSRHVILSSDSAAQDAIAKIAEEIGVSVKREATERKRYSSFFYSFFDTPTCDDGGLERSIEKVVQAQEKLDVRLGELAGEKMVMFEQDDSVERRVGYDVVVETSSYGEVSEEGLIKELRDGGMSWKEVVGIVNEEFKELRGARPVSTIAQRYLVWKRGESGGKFETGRRRYFMDDAKKCHTPYGFLFEYEYIERLKEDSANFSWKEIGRRVNGKYKGVCDKDGNVRPELPMFTIQHRYYKRKTVALQERRLARLLK